MDKPMTFEEFIKAYPAGHPLYSNMRPLGSYYKGEIRVPYLRMRWSNNTRYCLYRAPWWRRILDRIAVWRENRRFPEGAAPFW